MLKMLTIPSLSLLIPWSKIFSLILSRLVVRSPCRGPSRVRRSRDNISVGIVFLLVTCRRVADEPGVLMTAASLLDRPRLCGMGFARRLESFGKIERARWNIGACCCCCRCCDVRDAWMLVRPSSERSVCAD
jgi:hypothetical protein